ncbi:MAG: UbiA family prenyltransferase [Anaerolineae bacterium]|nr:UbiA family prenyltransferase [Anaerolineae bacterium]MDH7475157.1 UbiA family prenyltransferase [Anaerolineae bacterium]
MRKILRFLSWRDWGIIRYNSVFQNAVAFFYLALAYRDFSLSYIWRVLLFGLFSTLGTGYGYLINDFADRELDRLHGKRNAFHGVSTSVAVAVLVLVLLASVVVGWPFLRQPWFAAIWGVWVCVATFYSMPPLRLKERGGWGLAATVIAQQTLPAALVFAAFGRLSTWGALAFVVYATVRGLSSDAGHQWRDWARDSSTGTRTFAVRRGYAAISRLYALSLEVEKVLLGVVLLVMLRNLPGVPVPGLSLRIGLAWPLVVFYVPLWMITAGWAWKGMRCDKMPDPYDESLQGPERDLLHLVHQPFPVIFIPLYLASWMTVFYWPNLLFIVAMVLLYGLYSPRRWASSWPLRLFFRQGIR